LPRNKKLGVAALLVLAMGPRHVEASLFHRTHVSQARHAAGVSLRKRLNVNDLITEPGTVEIDWGTLYSYTTETLTLPSALKYTPSGGSLLWGKTEYSVAFDSVSSAVNAGGRSTQFSDRLTFAATSIVYDSPHFDIAIAPQITAFLRNDSGVRIGGTVIGRYDRNGNTLGMTVSWTGATTSSDTNPAGIWDIGAGYGRRVAASGKLSKITPHLNWIYERATGVEMTHSGFAGVEYQATEKVAFDVSAQRYNIVGGAPDRQLLVSVTVNLGHVR